MERREIGFLPSAYRVREIQGSWEGVGPDFQSEPLETKEEAEDQCWVNYIGKQTRVTFHFTFDPKEFIARMKRLGLHAYVCTSEMVGSRLGAHVGMTRGR